MLADKASDTDEIVDAVPPRSDWSEKREYDWMAYKLRHPMGNGFVEFKRWRGIVKRPAKRLRKLRY